ncbi:MAG TPA: twin-arginine translocase TatA/TatE family subunit [Pyrinomonadaceae bacterium]|jgi:TatA/E family protein of Tat protein translocase|nr:twin-arginine translocase TatA/TatE family subunit [Pyrinomonadaceae bacterium]
MVLLFLESLGTTELLVILLVALVLFGPRKLPEMTRKFGKSLNEFKRASDDFKRTWEREVAMESVEREAAIDRAMVAEPQTENFAATEASIGGTRAADTANARDITEAAVAPVQGANVARGAHVETPAHVAVNADEPETEAAEQQPSRKTDWL